MEHPAHTDNTGARPAIDPGASDTPSKDAEAPVRVRNLVKRYGDYVAVDHLSFEVHRGEIFGLLGPNGAGKTTTIRMIMDIFKPDAGTVTILGRPPAEARESVGYLPEDRGLYSGMKVLDTLVYLGELKGVDRGIGRQRGREWLEKVGLAEWADHKVQDLSRGMRQKLQFVASLVHDPEVLILDEPFQGLDPVNIDLIRRLIRELHEDGKTIVLSAHQMNLVEALCDRIVLIDHGRAVLYGRIADIKAEHAPLAVHLRTPDPLPSIDGVAHAERHGDVYVVTLQDLDPQDFLKALVARDVTVQRFELASAPLEDIFIAVVSGHVVAEPPEPAPEGVGLEPLAPELAPSQLSGEAPSHLSAEEGES